MGCKYFSLEIIGDKHESLENVKIFTGKVGVIFAGDDLSGNFNGNGVRGDYVVRGDNLDIRIFEKPVFMPCSFIKLQMRKAMRGEPPQKYK